MYATNRGANKAEKGAKGDGAELKSSTARTGGAEATSSWAIISSHSDILKMKLCEDRKGGDESGGSATAEAGDRLTISLLSLSLSFEHPD